jgi:uncharacterized membrane protein YhfC
MPVLVGMLGFIVFVLVLERSIHGVVFEKFPLRDHPFMYVVYGIFMAGICEETARFISFNILKKKYTGIYTGLAYGIGHGGAEALLMSGLPMINSIVLSGIINSGTINNITAPLPESIANQVHTQVTTLVDTVPLMFLISGIERIFAIGIHIALSIIVYYSVFSQHSERSKFSKYARLLFPAAILLHAIVDIPAALFQLGLIKNIVMVEVILCLSSTLLLLFAWYVQRTLKASLIIPDDTSDIVKRMRNHEKKILAPIIISLGIGAYIIGGGLLVLKLDIPHIPPFIKIAVLIVYLLVLIVLGVVLKERIKEVRRGEEDDLDKY